MNIHFSPKREMDYAVVEVARLAADADQSTTVIKTKGTARNKPFLPRSVIGHFFITSQGLGVGPGSFGSGVVPPNTPMRQNNLFTDNAVPPIVASNPGNSPGRLGLIADAVPDGWGIEIVVADQPTYVKLLWHKIGAGRDVTGLLHIFGHR